MRKIIFRCVAKTHTKKKLLKNKSMKRHSCNFQACCYKTDHSRDLVSHKRTHTGEKPHKCNECDYKCTQAGNLKDHKRTHTGEKPYKCNECDFACTQAGNLVTHKRSHTGEKPYKCDVCDFACITSGHLVTHKRTHTGEKPHKCNECDYKCTQAGTLAKHKQCWHTVDGIQRKKNRENALMEYIKEHYTVDREQQINNSCFESQKKFARVDGVIYLANLTVIVEGDENQHKFYNDS